MGELLAQVNHWWPFRFFCLISDLIDEIPLISESRLGDCRLDHYLWARTGGGLHDAIHESGYKLSLLSRDISNWNNFAFRFLQAWAFCSRSPWRNRPICFPSFLRFPWMYGSTWRQHILESQYYSSYSPGNYIERGSIPAKLISHSSSSCYSYRSRWMTVEIATTSSQLLQ